MVAVGILVSTFMRVYGKIFMFAKVINFLFGSSCLYLPNVGMIVTIAELFNK